MIVAHRPELFLLDEAFEGVDAAGARLMKEILLDQVRRGATMFLTSHGGSADIIVATRNARHELLSAGPFGQRGGGPIENTRATDLSIDTRSTRTAVAPEKRRRSAAVGRRLRLLRAHGLIQKVPHTHRYHVTTVGRLAITALLTVDRTSLARLTRIAA